MTHFKEKLKASYFIEISFLIGLLFLWETLCRQNYLPRYLIPSPSDIINAYIENPQTFRLAFLETAMSSFFGFILSAIIGISLGAVLNLSPLLNRLIFPVARFFQTVPIIAIAPLLVIYFGFGDTTVIAASFIVSLFPMIATTVVGLESTPAEYVELYQYGHSSKLRMLFELRIGFALPILFSGFRICSGLAVIGAIAGEFVAGGGLGQVIDLARTQQRIDQVYLALILLSFIGFIYLAIIYQIQRLVQFWRPYFPIEK